ncbi:MAG: hypothetical protein KAT69_03220 [Candidatus Aminicenantes bacterium]|nr:hypothetical protein [Candidatus Aminicenantes bacterium]
MADRDEIGQGDHWTQNPPPIDGSDIAIWIWYHGHVNQFVQEFNLMPALYKDLNLNGVDEELFLKKISMIHNVMNNLRVKKSEREGK